MKTEPMAAVARLRKARTPWKVCFEERRKTVLRPLVAFLAVLFLAPLLIGQAEAACPPSKRLKHSRSSCIHAWWDNSPSSTCWGTKGGARSFCSQYGWVEANVDIINDTDKFLGFGNASKLRYKDCNSDTRQISCCMDTSDLCLKQQAKAEDGIIKQWTGSGTSFRDIDVSTQANRYEFCSENRNNIYCKRTPGTNRPPDCVNDGECTVEDCWEEWNASAASAVCTAPPSFSLHPGIIGNSPYDSVTVAKHCKTGLPGISCTALNGATDSFSRPNFYVWELADVVVCGDTTDSLSLQVGPC